MYNCEYAFNGKMIDKPYSIWASNNEGVGAWIQINFKSDYQVNFFFIFN